MKPKHAFILILIILAIIWAVNKYGIENLKVKVDYGEESFEQEVQLKELEKFKDIDVEQIVDDAVEQVDKELNRSDNETE